MEGVSVGLDNYILFPRGEKKSAHFSPNDVKELTLKEKRLFAAAVIDSLEGRRGKKKREINKSVTF